LEFLPGTIEAWGDEGTLEAWSEWKQFEKNKAKLDVMKGFMVESDRKRTVHDIWRISSDGTSLFEYCNYLRTACFGLVLVRCKFGPDGTRELELR
jgi:ribosomal protein S8